MAVWLNNNNGGGKMVHWDTIPKAYTNFRNERGQTVCRECAVKTADEIAVVMESVGSCASCQAKLADVDIEALKSEIFQDRRFRT